MYKSPKKPSLQVTDHVTITDFVREFLHLLAKCEGGPIKLNNEIDITRVRALINDPAFTTFKSPMRLDANCPYWNEQEIVTMPSNLGPEKGCLFYFVCNRCGRRTKFLFFYSILESPICRQCCRLPYKQMSYATRKARMVEKRHHEKHGSMTMLRPDDVIPQ